MTAPIRPPLPARPGPAYNPGVSVGQGGAIPAMPPRPAVPPTGAVPFAGTPPISLPHPPTPGGGGAQPFVQPPVNAGAPGPSIAPGIPRPPAPGIGGGFQPRPFTPPQMPPGGFGGMAQAFQQSPQGQGIMAAIRNRLGQGQPGGSPGMVNPGRGLGLGMAAKPQVSVMDRIRQYFQNRGGAGGGGGGY